MYRSTFFSFLAVAVAAAVLATGSAQAGYMYFDNNTADGKYETPGNWFDGSVLRYVPIAGDDGIIAGGLTATLSSSVYAYVPDNLYVGFVDPTYTNTSGDGTLTLDNAASLLNVGALSVGYSADSTGSTGTVNVSAGSLNTNGLSLGQVSGDNGTLSISGGTITSKAIYVGHGGEGTFNVNGADTDIDVSGNLFIANDATATGTMTMTDGSLTTTGSISVGAGNVGSLTISGGSLGTTGKWSTLYVGRNAGSDGTLYINETATTSPTVSVYNEESPISQVISIGHEAGATGKVIQTGGTFTSDGWLTAVGRYGTGEYELSGGTADFHNICVGYEAGGTGTFTHTGGTIDNGTGGFRVGGSGTGTYTMSDTAECNFDGIIIIAHLAGSQGTLNVNGGTFSDYGNGHDIYVGEKGVGRLNVTGGTISVRDIHVGQAAAGVGYVDQDGGSITAGKIMVGYRNDGTLGDSSYDMSGGTLTCRNGGGWDGIYVGYTGSDSRFNQTGGAVDADWISVGSDAGGNGTMNVSGGTMNAVNEFSIGGNATATGVVNVSGGTITLDAGYMYVGHRGIGTLNLTGGTVTSYEGRIGNDAGSNGDATVSGSGSHWINTGSLHVGELGNGTLEISNQGLVVVTGILAIDSDLDGDAFVNMSTGGMLALMGDADDSLTDFLELIDGTDAIRYWDDSLSGWVDLTQAAYGEDYTLTYLNEGDLAGYTRLTIGGTAALIPGDLNGDGFVGSDDLDVVRSHWGQYVEPGLLSAGDASGDGHVGSPDLDIVRSNWGQGAQSRAAAVPEPGLPLLLFIATAMVLRRARPVSDEARWR